MSELIKYADLTVGDVILQEILDMRGGCANSTWKFLPFVVTGIGPTWYDIAHPTGLDFGRFLLSPEESVTRLSSPDEVGWWTPD